MYVDLRELWPRQLVTETKTSLLVDRSADVEFADGYVCHAVLQTDDYIGYSALKTDVYVCHSALKINGYICHAALKTASMTTSILLASLKSRHILSV